MSDLSSDRLVEVSGQPVEPMSARMSTGPDRTMLALDNDQPLLDGEGRPVQELDVERPDEIAQRSATVRQLAVDEQVWRFGHVIVDEAQDLTPMQWRMVVRRSRKGAVTVLGDLAQRSIGEPGTWDDHLPPELSLYHERALTTNYRSPAEINDLAAAVLADLAPGLPQSRAVRRSGRHPVAIRVESIDRDLPRVVADLAGSTGVCPGGDRRMAPAVIGFDLAQPPDRSPGTAALHDARLLSPWQAKGLEFDSVVVVEPARFLDEENGLSLLYVALTRSTDRLAIVHQRPLPDSLAAVARS